MRAWSFCCVSSSPQEATLEDQANWAHEAASANGWDVTRVFSGVGSGKAGPRKLLHQLVAELRSTPEAERPQVILMLRLDRVGRGRLADSMLVMRELEDLGCAIFTRDGGLELMDAPMKELITAAKLAVAAFENEVRKEKSRAFHARKKAAGEYASTLPYGFILLEKRLAPYEPEAAVVRDLYEKRVAGWGYQRLAVHAKGIAPPKLKANGKSRALAWSTATLQRILSNDRYRGVIVPETLWDDVAAMRGRLIERSAVWPWPLRGAVRCTCGGLLRGQATGPRRLRYYVCRLHNRHGGRFPYHNAAQLEAQFVALLSRLEPSGDLKPLRSVGDVAAMRSRKAHLAKELASIEQRKMKAWELAEGGEIQKGDLADRLADLGAEAERISQALHAAERELASAEARENIKADVAQAIRGLASAWPRQPVALQRDIARAVAAYVGGLFADPERPSELFMRDIMPRNAGSCHSLPEASPWEMRALLALCGASC